MESKEQTIYTHYYHGIEYPNIINYIHLMNRGPVSFDHNYTNNNDNKNNTNSSPIRFGIFFTPINLPHPLSMLPTRGSFFQQKSTLDLH